jgi:preprotein translocase SecE subunit
MVNTEKKTASKKIVIKKKVTKFTPKREVPRALKPLASFGEYFKGAWFELRQVRWPNRRATWSLTGAVLLFTGFFVALILLLDVLFQFLFNQILK